MLLYESKRFKQLIQGINGLFLLSRDSLIVLTNILGTERFKITIYVFLIVVGWKDYNMNIRNLSNL